MKHPDFPRSASWASGLWGPWRPGDLPQGVMAGSKTGNPQSKWSFYLERHIQIIYRWWIFHDFSVELALTYKKHPLIPPSSTHWSAGNALVERFAPAGGWEIETRRPKLQATNIPVSGRYPFSSRRWEQLRTSVDIYRFFSDIYIYIYWMTPMYPLNSIDIMGPSYVSSFVFADGALASALAARDALGFPRWRWWMSFLSLANRETWWILGTLVVLKVSGL